MAPQLTRYVELLLVQCWAALQMLGQHLFGIGSACCVSLDELPPIIHHVIILYYITCTCTDMTDPSL